jgi:hypothetical protein
MRATLDAEISSSSQRCACGHIRAEHAREETEDGGTRHGRCRRCGRECEVFRLSGVDLEAELAAIAEQTGESIETVRDLWSAMESVAEEPEIEERLEAQYAAEIVTPPAEVLSTWDGWQCAECGCRYRQGAEAGPHGAPTQCPGELIPVTVTVTRRAAGSSTENGETRDG